MICPIRGTASQGYSGSINASSVDCTARCMFYTGNGQCLFKTALEKYINSDTKENIDDGKSH